MLNNIALKIPNVYDELLAFVMVDTIMLYADKGDFNHWKYFHVHTHRLTPQYK